MSKTLPRWRLAVALASLLLVAAEKPAAPSFDGTRAFKDLRDLVGFGPRIPGTEAARKARELIRDRLRQAGWTVQSQAVTAVHPDGTSASLENLWAVKARPGKLVVLVLAHFDSKQLPMGGAIPGANDGASGTALLLELARALPEGLPDRELWLVFCDGSEAVGPEVTPTDGMYGSRDFARSIEKLGLFERITAVVFVDLVAGRNLQISPGQPRSQRLGNVLQGAASDMSDPNLLDLKLDVPPPTDQRAFSERGVVEILSVTDIHFTMDGSSGTLFHSLLDDIGGVDTAPLQRSGQLVLNLLKRL